MSKYATSIPTKEGQTGEQTQDCQRCGRDPSADPPRSTITAREFTDTTSREGAHDGDIMECDGATADQYGNDRSTMADDGHGLAWHRYMPIAKPVPTAEVGETGLEDSQRLKNGENQP